MAFLFLAADDASNLGAHSSVWELRKCSLKKINSKFRQKIARLPREPLTSNHFINRISRFLKKAGSAAHHFHP